MLLLNEETVIVCAHKKGRVSIEPSQGLVTIAGKRVIVVPDVQGRPVKGCPNFAITIKPCTNTLPVVRGHSKLLRIKGQRVCLDNLGGLTDGTPPGLVEYLVQDPGQQFVFEGK